MPIILFQTKENKTTNICFGSRQLIDCEENQNMILISDLVV